MQSKRRIVHPESTAFPTNRHSMKASAYIAQSLYAKQLATLTQLYLELRLPLSHALRAAEADLGQPKDLDLVIERDPAAGKCRRLGRRTF
jgi:hypothetical protein